VVPGAPRSAPEGNCQPSSYCQSVPRAQAFTSKDRRYRLQARFQQPTGTILLRRILCPLTIGIDPRKKTRLFWFPFFSLPDHISPISSPRITLIISVNPQHTLGILFDDKDIPAHQRSGISNVRFPSKMHLKPLLRLCRRREYLRCRFFGPFVTVGFSITVSRAIRRRSGISFSVAERKSCPSARTRRSSNYNSLLVRMGEFNI